MPLTNDEFTRLEAARMSSVHLRQEGGQKRVLQLAFEQLEDLAVQQVRAVKAIEALLQQRNKSLCYLAPRFFAFQWAWLKSWLR